MKPRELKGRRFGRLLVVGREINSATGRARWLCRCDCGKQIVAHGTNLLKDGHTQSCGCLRRDVAAGNKPSLRHGQSKDGKRLRTLVYQTWCAMNNRCTNPKNRNWADYGGRGIRVCKRWRDSFEAFLADMGDRPPGTSLDRFPDPNGNYEPGNTRWATAIEQAKSKRLSRERVLAVLAEFEMEAPDLIDRLRTALLGTKRPTTNATPGATP